MAHNPRVTTVQKEILGRFTADMQETGCDAIIVIGTSTKNNKTKSFVYQHGNELLCNSLLHHAFQTETFIYQDEEIEDDNE